MNSKVTVVSVKSKPILMLQVSTPAAVSRALAVHGQTAVNSFHITLARLDDQGAVLPENCTLPKPPSTVGLSEDVQLVDTGVKQACFVEVSPESQAELEQYVRQCEAALGISVFEPGRVFHVTLTNAGGGDVRASVSSVWAHESRVV